MRLRLGGELGLSRLSASLWEMPPGQAAYPYHFHLADEELLLVLSGTPDLRGPDGWRRLEEGEIVAFPTGPEGAHQLVNRGESVVRFFVVSTSGTPDIVHYPDSQKVFAGGRIPDGSGEKYFFRKADAGVEYLEGETPPSPG